jgi:hypothetical protein
MRKQQGGMTRAPSMRRCKQNEVPPGVNISWYRHVESRGDMCLAYNKLFLLRWGGTSLYTQSNQKAAHPLSAIPLFTIATGSNFFNFFTYIYIQYLYSCWGQVEPRVVLNQPTRKQASPRLLSPFSLFKLVEFPNLFNL